ncbi:MAG: ASCH domain-containing protein [Planctomycetes bacterium]|nr:ASCH domain-containing protein [Planctomycetota bacterium]
MLGISVWQPWASLIAAGAKRYETRSWQPPASLIGQRLAICSSRTAEGLHDTAQDDAFNRLCLRRLGQRQLPMGRVVAVVTVEGCIATTSRAARRIGVRERLVGDWSPGRYAWRLADVQTLAAPVPVTGSQRFFYLPPRVLARVLAQIGGET